MSEMTERMAEAMRLRAIERGHPIHPVLVRHLAHAALNAMREPTEAMKAATSENTWHAVQDYQAMIDKALE